MNLSIGTAQTLERFVADEMDSDEFDAWLVSIQDDESLFDAERVALARLRLLAIESGEGLRDASEVRSAAAALLTDGDGYFMSSSNATQELRVQEVTVLGTARASVQ